MSVDAIWSSFLLVAASEMGDKTQLLAFSLASRYRRGWTVMAGIVVATLANHLLAASVGSWVAEHVPRRLMAGILAATFIAFGVWALRPDDDDDSAKPSRWGPFLTTTVLFFLAEMGDKTQLATMALGAEFRSAISVTLGTTTGMVLSDGLAVFLGDRLATRARSRWIRWVSAGLFFVFGLASAWAAWRG